MRSTRRAPLLLYVGLTYLVFWILLGVTGGLIALKVPSLAITVMQNVCAWSPTFVIAILFKRLYPNTSLAEYLRRQFLSRVNGVVFLLLLAVQAVVVALAIAAHSMLGGASLAALSFVGFSALPSTLLVNITSGPVGEELGWRGFVLNDLQKRHTPFVSALLLGVIWGFWHTPLWIISGYAGARLIGYVIFFLVGIVSLSVVITVFYNHHKNILVAMWIHFLFNFLLQLTDIAPYTLLAYTSAGYLVLAAILVFCDRRSLFHGPAREDHATEALA